MEIMKMGRGEPRAQVLKIEPEASMNSSFLSSQGFYSR